MALPRVGDVGPVALKGVASAKDATRALETDSIIWVSNCGGRQLEDSIALRRTA